MTNSLIVYHSIYVCFYFSFVCLVPFSPRLCSYLLIPRGRNQRYTLIVNKHGVI